MQLGGKTLLIVVLIPAAMLVTAGATYILVAPPAAAGSDEKGQGKQDAAATKDQVAGDANVEVLIDNFTSTNHRAAAGSTIHVSFKAVCIVPGGQHLSFEELANKTHKTRVRQAIERIIRSATLEDLHDPNLSTIRRQIRDDINKQIGRHFVSDVALSDVRLIEQ